MENNIFDSEKYQEARKAREEYFAIDNLDHLVTDNETCQDFKLVVGSYKTSEGCWNYTRGLVYKGKEVIADIKRNYGSFPYTWVEHSNGNVYLICGEDYQGYTIVNCTKGEIKTFIPEGWLKGWGFCWADIEIDGDNLVVSGCYWGAPFERVTYDFSNPDILPLPELSREEISIEEDDDE